MAGAANWVSITLLFSVCLSASYGKRTGISTMADGADGFQPSNGFPHEADPDSSTSIDPDPTGFGAGIGIGYERSPYCIDCDDVDIMGGSFCGACNYGCPYRRFNNGCGGGIAYMDELKRTIKDLTMKLDANGLLGKKKAMNIQAMAPESS
ncbi:hypothetical protein ERO13_A06G126602v2 [Gossypium hirsutum]|uniref:4Fe-4S ferredoxin-type domain-containing protein n=2 Tax=Gossypium TaxID=3633 RepID=A0A2P5RQM1_GOSBA|nr:hypothetical protein ES319_A06G135700v1 [Gossypium barbadense]KAG4195702.1 hypothetical protein ERO13_A06G126602v2 [Gossypium hirsutum]PPD89106.1 hypothetical protein GOBAR_DD13961 [Gossypium barbadense]PPS07540.1 hypothetical protein GOBAR_AA13102 [Gossypium barbadense]TYH13608.1 hypothetical protein ES288_A06G152100v1 [Gossypium darwinii]